MESHVRFIEGSASVGGRGSGDYAETVFQYSAKVLFRREIDGPLDFRIIRNSDFRELSLEVEGKTVLNFAICYGFQNLQNIARKVKTRKCDNQFVEVMACTSGFCFLVSFYLFGCQIGFLKHPLVTPYKMVKISV
ncbi:hypothetical protein J1N35_009658 [Gossypium stocksii]|uniref:Iron hydrogenase large subunit C-terminal domain-containing protein n=1 Tax=Gossypium stocksii TaxID=47602 RepID=A0A9D3W118_9ROSI|nr:hypothetical protein J1N35_009658 [Gossypium stocksii]